MTLRYIPMAVAVLSLTGCLVTRQEVRNSVKGEPLSADQQKRADTEVRLQEFDEQVRYLTGRVETVENTLGVLSADKNGSRMEHEAEKRALQEKLAIYEEALGKLETQYLALAQRVEALNQAQGASRSSARDKDGANKGLFESADSEYSKKRWKEAIVAFEKYRSQHPSGKNYGQATYKIGASFHELGMKTEAKAFYSEVVDKFPKSEWAKKAQQRLKALK